MDKTLILVVEDDLPVQNLITVTLKAEGYRYLTAQTGQAAVITAATHNPDIILLDLGLPDLDGVEVIRRVRSWSNVPIIVISARSEDPDKIDALDAGADDYLTKPFAMKELLARVRSMTRRHTEYSGRELKYGDIVLNAANFELAGINSVRLSIKEFELMQTLMLNAERPLDTRYILEHVWANEPEARPDTVWLYISYLKGKLRSVDSRLSIEGERGGSFRLIKA